MTVQELIQMSNLRLIFIDSKTDSLIYDYNNCCKVQDVKFINTYCDKKVVKLGSAFINGLYVYIRR